MFKPAQFVVSSACEPGAPEVEVLDKNGSAGQPVSGTISKVGDKLGTRRCGGQRRGWHGCNHFCLIPSWVWIPALPQQYRKLGVFSNYLSFFTETRRGQCSGIFD